MTTDPVCGMRVNDIDPDFETKFAGRRYIFCSEKCQQEFEQRPEEYVEAAA
jgi:Cu+-exporting ATPase